MDREWTTQITSTDWNAAASLDLAETLAQAAPARATCGDRIHLTLGNHHAKHRKESSLLAERSDKKRRTVLRLRDDEDAMKSKGSLERADEKTCATSFGASRTCAVSSNRICLIGKRRDRRPPCPAWSENG